MRSFTLCYVCIGLAYVCRFSWEQIVACLWGSPPISVSLHPFACLPRCLTAVPRQVSASQRLGLDLNTLPWDAPGGDLTPSAKLVYLEMRREYTRERDD